MRRLLLLLALSLAGCATAASPVERARYLMGTVCEIELPSPAAADRNADRAFSEIDRIERLLSTWRSDSELSRLNAAPEGVEQEVSPELRSILSEALTLARRTDGAFNPLVGRLVDAWKTRAEGALPGAATLADAVRSASLDNVKLDRTSIVRTSGAEFEEGGFGKGYALDRALDVLRGNGESKALINFGGQVAAYGYGDRLEVDLALPDDRETPALRIRTRDGSVSTSSGSEKTFVVDGHTFSHILDPRTGAALPPRGSATVIAGRAFEADALSTALYVLGPREGIRWADENDVAAIFLTPVEDAHGFEVAMSRAARDRIFEARILSPVIRASNMKGFNIK